MSNKYYLIYLMAQKKGKDSRTDFWKTKGDVTP